MQTALQELEQHVNELKNASIIQRGEIALRALDAALHAMQSQQHDIAGIRERLLDIEARAARRGQTNAA